MSETILVLDRVAPAPVGARPLATRGLTRDTFDSITKATAQSVDTLSTNLAVLVGSLQGMLAKATAIKSDFILETVDVEVSVTADGQFGLLGTSVGVEGHAALTLSFKRKE